MKGAILMVLAAVLSVAVVVACAKTSPAEDVPKLAKEELKSMLGNPDIIILDVRPLEQWSRSDLKIPGALHEDPRDVKSWADKYPKDKTLVFY